MNGLVAIQAIGPSSLVVRAVAGPPASVRPAGAIPGDRAAPESARPESAGTTRPVDRAGAQTPVRRGEGRPADGRPGDARRAAEGQRDGTAYQTNADGDSATFDSRLAQLTPEERTQLEQLQQRDQEVRTHEEAHKSAAGPLFRGGPYYKYQTGPDGRRYAIGGSVNIDTSKADTPEKTIAKAQQIRRAALAPAEPSSTDRSVAAKASRMEAEARRELNQARDADAGDAAGDASAGTRADLATGRTEPGADPGRTDARPGERPGAAEDGDVRRGRAVSSPDVSAGSSELRRPVDLYA